MRCTIKRLFAAVVFILLLLCAVVVGAQQSDADINVTYWSGDAAGEYTVGVELNNVLDSCVVVAAQYKDDILQKVELKNGTDSQCKFRVDSSIQSVDIIALESTENLRPMASKTTVACSPDCEVRYETLVVASPYTQSGYTILRDKTDLTKRYEFSNDEVEATKISALNGQPIQISLSSIVNFNVVSIAYPLDENEKATVMVSDMTVSGEVGAVDYENNTITIGDTKYDFSDYYRELISYDIDKFGCAAEDDVKMYLDCFGRVVYIEVVLPPYGYLIDYTESEDGVALRLLDASGKIVTYKLNPSVRINDVNMEDHDAVYELARSAARIEECKTERFKAPDQGYKYVVSQIVRYKTATENGVEVIKKLYTVSSHPTYSSYEENGGIIPAWTNIDNSEIMAPFISCRNRLTCSGTGTAKLFKVNGTSQFCVNHATVVFKVPSDRSNIDAYRRAKGSSSFTDVYNYFVEAYDIDGTNAKAVVYYMTSVASTTTIAANTSSYIVTGKELYANDAGKPVHRLSYIRMGDDASDISNFKTVLAADTVTLAEYGAGDVIRFTQTNGVIDAVDKLFVYNEKTVYTKELSGGAYVYNPAEDNYFSQKYNSKSDYFQAHLGKVYTLAVDNSGIGEITIYTDESQSDYNLYNLTEDTRYYISNNNGDIENAGSGYIADTYSYDYESASEVLVISYDDQVNGVYIVY